MIKFEFKRTNQELTVHYCPLALVVGGTIRPSSSADGTARFGQALPLPSVQASTSPLTGGTAQQAGATASGRAVSPPTGTSLMQKMHKRNGTQAHYSHWGICANTWCVHSRYQSARGSQESDTDCGRCGLWEPEGRACGQGRSNRGGIPVEMGMEADRWGGGGML
jgi:hypothetical protein